MYHRTENANYRSGAGADSEAVEAEHGAEIRASLSFLGLKRNAGRVRHSVDRVEQADDRGGIDKPFWAQGPQQPGPGADSAAWSSSRTASAKRMSNRPCGTPASPEAAPATALRS